MTRRRLNRPGTARGALLTIPVILALFAVGAGSGRAQSGRTRLDFLDEKLKIPESGSFVEADYIESGVGLTFGVDKRLTYLAGNHAEAAQRFEAAVKRYRHKSEIWVYLARAYFYTKEPGRARDALDRAAKVMPDLTPRLWQPLRQGLLWEIRKRANQLQVQVDFYSQNHEDYLALFRLYRFLEDYLEATAVVRAAEAKERKMYELAEMASGTNQRVYRETGEKWGTLADGLWRELRALGRAGDRADTGEQTRIDRSAGIRDAELREATRLLQLKVDYYQAQKQDYRTLCDNYLKLGQPAQARGVLKVVDRQIRDVRARAAVAPSVQEELRLEDQAKELEALQQNLRKALDKDEGSR